MANVFGFESIKKAPLSGAFLFAMGFGLSHQTGAFHQCFFSIRSVEDDAPDVNSLTHELPLGIAFIPDQVGAHTAEITSFAICQFSGIAKFLAPGFYKMPEMVGNVNMSDIAS